MLVYNPQEGGIADQAYHKNDDGNDGVDVLKIAVNRWIYGTHWGFSVSFIGGAGPQSLCIKSSMRGNTGSCAWTDGGMEVWRMESGVDQKTWERVLSFVDLAQTHGHHTDHEDKQTPCWWGHCQRN